jgi:hypothetical protein
MNAIENFKTRWGQPQSLFWGGGRLGGIAREMELCDRTPSLLPIPRISHQEFVFVHVIPD